MDPEMVFVDFVVRQLVNHPSEVRIEKTTYKEGVLLELTVDPEDVGRVIGKKGVIIQSLRTLLRSLGRRNNVHYNLRIMNSKKENLV